MEENLQKYLSELTDGRRAQGKRYSLSSLVVLMIIGMMSGREGYRSVARFARQHESFFQQLFGWRHRSPSHVTLSTAINGVDVVELERSLNSWLLARSESGEVSSESDGALEGSKLEGVSIDGKSIKSSTRDAVGKGQNYIMVIHAFCQEKQQLLGARSYENKHAGETDTMLALIDELGLENKTITLDAGHGKKKC